MNAGAWKRARTVTAALIWAGLIVFLLYNRERITVDTLVSLTPEIWWRAFCVLMVFFAVKSLSIFLYSGILYAVSGALFPLPLAVLVNLCGTAVMVTIPYWIGRIAGAPLMDQISEKHPRTALLRERRGIGDFQFSLLSRVINVLSSDLLSLYMGASRVRYWPYLAGCLLGMLPPTIILPVLGTQIRDRGSPQFKIALIAQLCYLAGTALLCFLVCRKRGVSFRRRPSETQNRENMEESS